MTSTVEFVCGRWRRVAGLLIAAAALLAMPARSQSVDPEKTCRFDVSAPPDTQIKDCSLLIQSNAQPVALSGFYMIRGRAFNAKQDYDRALADFNEAIQSNPRSVTALTLRGDFFVERREYDRAIRDFEQAIELDPSSAAAFADRESARISARFNAGTELFLQLKR